MRISFEWTGKASQKSARAVATALCAVQMCGSEDVDAPQGRGYNIYEMAKSTGTLFRRDHRCGTVWN